MRSARMLNSALLAATLTGCATSTLPAPGPEDCQIRAGAALTEGSISSATLGGVSADARAGAVTVLGRCENHDRLHVLTRSNGSTVCYGDLDVCAAAIANQPVTVTRDAFDAMLQAMEMGR